MTDQNTDLRGTIDLYRAALPVPDTMYRGRLRSTLATARPSPQRRLGWRAPALGGVSLAAALALVLFLLPLLSHNGGSASAAALLVRVAAGTAPPHASFGTAEWIGGASSGQLVPAKAVADLGRQHVTTTWAIADDTHFRTESRTSSPPLLTQTSIYAANGGASAVWYNDIGATAIRMPLPRNGSPAAAELLTTGGALPPIAGTIRGYVDQYNHLRSGVHARLLPQQTYLGRTADVIEVRPASTTTGTSCTLDARHRQHCTEVTRRYGKQLIWVDHEYPTILQVLVQGIPARFGGNYTYRVTAITFDHQPTPEQLAFTSPVPVTDPPNGGVVVSSGGSSIGPIGGKGGWRAPEGFISAGRPIGSHGVPYTSSGSSQGGAPGGGGIASAAVIFARQHTPLRGPTKDFVLVQEQERKNGPPPLFTTGTPAGGTCGAVTGSFPDGLHWLGFSRGSIYGLISSDRFSERDLVHYLNTKVCI